jgi:hypothetical protein
MAEDKSKPHKWDGYEPRTEFVVVTKKTVKDKEEAARFVDQPGAFVYALARGRCPKGADHAHMRYDGVTYCTSCEQYLSIKLPRRFERVDLH